MIAPMAGRARRGQGEPVAVRAARERERHLQQVTSYGFLVRLGPKRSVTVTPAPLRYWQYDAVRAHVVGLAALGFAAWFGWLAARDGSAGVHRNLGLGIAVAVVVLVFSTGRLTVSDSAVSTDIAGLRRTSSFGVVPLSLVCEVVRGSAPAGWQRPRRRGGWWPGRSRVTVRHLGPDGDGDRAFTVWVRDPAAFADALGAPLGG
jgi:hypothetical protein